MTHSNNRPSPALTLQAIRRAIAKLDLNNEPRGKVIYIRRDAWPAIRREFEARALVRLEPARNGLVGTVRGIDLFVTDMPLPKAWCWDVELGIKP